MTNIKYKNGLKIEVKENRMEPTQHTVQYIQHGHGYGTAQLTTKCNDFNQNVIQQRFQIKPFCLYLSA